MNKVRLSFKDTEVEQTYQQKQFKDVRQLFFTVISIGLFVNYLVNVLNSIAMNRNDYLFWKITMMGYLIVQYYLIRRFPKFLRLAFIVTNHLNSGLYLFASDDSFTHEFDIIKGANQMALEIIIFLSGEFVDAALSIVTLNTLRMVYGIIYSPIQFYVPHITTVLLVGYFIYYFYQFHHAKRSQFLLSLVDIEWDSILSNLIQKTPYVIFTFDEEQLKFSIKQINNCNQIFSSKADILQFLRNSICHGKSVEQIIYEDIRGYSINHKKRINIQLHAQYNKEIYRLKYSLFQAQRPTLLLMFTGQSQKKNKLAKFDRKYNQFVTLFIKVLNNFNPNQEQFLECLQLKRQLYFFKLLGNIVDSQFHEKLVNVSQNLANISSLFPEKKIFFGNVECDIQIKTIGVILYFFEMIILENSIGQGVKINFVQQEQSITLTFQGTFNLHKIRYIIQQLQYPLKMIILNFKVTIYSIITNYIRYFNTTSSGTFNSLHQVASQQISCSMIIYFQLFLTNSCMIDQESLLAELGLLDKRKLLLELTIQLGVNEADIIYLYEGDDINLKAIQFCEKHQLKDEVKDIIAQNIKANLNEKENYFSFVNQPPSNVNTNKTPTERSQNTKKPADPKDKSSDLLNKSTSQIKKADIYTKQVKQQMCKNNILQKQRQEKELELMKNVTFKPKLSQNTLKIVTTARQNRNKTPEYYLLKYGQQMQEHRKQAEQQLQNETSRECSFRPEINKTSQKIYDESIKKDVSMTKFDQLYEQAKKKNKTEKSCVTQESRINTTTKRSNSRSKTPNKSYLPFLERMEMQKKLKEDKLKQEIEESFLYDDKSGQKLYQPSVNTAHRSRGGLSIGEYLYQQQRSIDESIVQFECDELSKSMQTEKSNQIVLQIRKKKLEEFFKLMDSDNDGLISAAHIYLEDLPTEALELLQPIILQLEKLDIYLNIETWTAKCMDIVEKMNVADKNRLFQKSFKQKTDPVDQSTFKPQLNQKSEMLAAKQRQVFKGPAALYEKAMKENMIKENKIKHFKEQKEQQESRQCTFQPKIKSFNRSTTQSIIYQ